MRGGVISTVNREPAVRDVRPKPTKMGSFANASTSEKSLVLRFVKIATDIEHENCALLDACKFTLLMGCALKL